MDFQPLLILGAPRSGTTLLAAMIGRHPDVAVLSENLGMAMRKVVGKRVAGNKLCIPNHIEMRETRPWWVGALGWRGHQVLYRRGFFRYRPEAPVSIEDYLALEGLRLVGILRDGRAVVSSIMKRGKQPAAVARHRWARATEILETLQARCGEHLLLLRFEQLVTEPNVVMRAVSAHLRLDYQERMLEGYAYTPIYESKGIDPEKARPAAREAAPRGTTGISDAAWARYDRLVEASRHQVGQLNRSVASQS